MSEENLHRNVKVSGWGSLFTDMSTEMILPVLPAFLVGVLKAPPGAVGLIEGVAESTASLFKYISGYISDKIRKRKLLVVLGYSFSAFVKPLLYFATSWTFVLAIRFLDRVGKGIRTSPRDALIADSSGKKKGKPFGFQRFMDTLGAVFGSTIALLILRTN
ncbi:MAG: MFS transporter, partial [bacterium]